MTRRLIASNQRPVTVGTFFSLGHSTYAFLDPLLDVSSALTTTCRIVVITSIVVAATAAAVSSKFHTYSTIGGIIGTSVSASFLILLGIMNMYILYKLIAQLRKVINLEEGQEQEGWKVQGGGCLFYVLKKLFKLIDR